MKISFDSIIKFSVYGAVFALPLVQFELNKLYVLFFFASLGMVSWFAKMVLKDREIVIKKTPLNFFVLAFLVVLIVSTLFSADKWASLLGSYGRFSDGLVGMLSFAGLYFLIVNNLSSKQVEFALKIFTASISLVILASYLSLFGILHLPTQSSEGLSVLLAFFAVTLAAAPFGIFSWILLFGSLGLLLLIDFAGAWIVLMAGLLGLLLFLVFQRIKIGRSDSEESSDSKRERLSVKKMWLPSVLLLVSFVFLYSPPFIQSQFKKELVLSQSISWHVGLRSATSSMKNVFFGSGPATFGIDFSKYEKPPRFDRSGSYLSELLGIAGFGGFLIYIILAFVAMIAFALRVAYKTHGKNGIMFFSALIALFATQWIYYQNTVLAFSFWLVLALGIAFTAGGSNEFRVSLKKYLEIAFLGRLLLLLIVIGVGASYVVAAKFYLADIWYAKPGLSNGLRAVALNPYRAEYTMRVSQLYFQNVLEELQKSQSEQDTRSLSFNAKQAILYGTRSSAFAPNRANVWEFLGSLYRDLRFASGAHDFAVQSFQKAKMLEPANPMLYNELGKLYLENRDFKIAGEQFEKALSLDKNFTDAALQEALLSEKEGDIILAISRIQDLLYQHPQDSEILFQLGRLYYNNNQVPEAIGALQQTIALNPSNSNAHFALGTAYEKQGDKKKALEEFKKVLELNPDNKEVADKLKTL